MVEKIQAIRGMNDILPSKSACWRELEQQFYQCLSQYGYQEIRFPIVESTLLFRRSIGEITDIVEKEMYTFTDLNGDSLTLRPEGTASCLRACLEHGLLHNQQQKLWYAGPMFRHEKPQKGRYRQFHQFGVEALNISGVAIEIELIAICYRLWQQLGIGSSLELHINSLGELHEREHYKKRLVDYFTAHFSCLDEDSRRRLHTNPLRILDSKNPDIQALLLEAPRLHDSLSEESRGRFEMLCQGLEKMDIPYTINPFLVRGLDYYGHLVFEWLTTKLGSQATVCAGGRYDALVEQLGGNAAPAVGFAMGIERLLLLLDTLDCPLKASIAPTFYFIADSDNARQQALLLAEKLRRLNSSWCIITNTSGGGFKSQFKKADKSDAQLAFIIGEDELCKEQVSIKNLRKEAEQVTIPWHTLGTWLHDYLGEK